MGEHVHHGDQIGRRAGCSPGTAIYKSSLSRPRQQLIELMQSHSFGRIEGLEIRDGNPVLNPPPRVVREIKFCAENGARPEKLAADFLVKSQVIELLDCFNRIGDGVIDVIEIKNGLPFRMFATDIGSGLA